MKKKIFDPEEMRTHIQFCTECQDDLVNFGLSVEELDEDYLRKRFEICRQTGKFKGECCAKLFIARADRDAALPEDED